jgi:hypothetical protein
VEQQFQILALIPHTSATLSVPFSQFWQDGEPEGNRSILLPLPSLGEGWGEGWYGLALIPQPLLPILGEGEPERSWRGAGEELEGSRRGAGEELEGNQRGKRSILPPLPNLGAGWFHTTTEKSLSPLEWTLAVSPDYPSGTLREQSRAVKD